ncbi:hypothetical protein [Agaribacter flavus]|uniref:Sulfotransferase family protein n=1 Tax=Agaribacter flavus TaxID=1902781 RepID=A0ABV7FTV5_9ALTE
MNYNKVLANCGWYYPRHALDKNGVSGGHSNLYKILRDEGVSKFRERIDEYIVKARARRQTLLISSEGLSQHPNDLYESLSGLNVRVVSFFRHPVEAFFSAYNQMIKRHFFTRKIDDYAERAINNVQPVLSGRHLFEWKERFDEAFAVLPYSSNAKTTASVVRMFFDYLGIPKEHFPSGALDEQVNSGYCLPALKLKRLTNLVLTNEDTRLNNKLDLFFQAASDTKQYDSAGADTMISEDTYKRLVEKFEKDVIAIESGFSITVPLNTEHCNKSVSSLKIIAEMIEIMQTFVQQEKSTYQRIRKRILVGDWYSDDPDHRQLCELFDCHFLLQVREKDFFFPDKILQKMCRYDKVDFLRETAKVLLARADYEHAYLLISEAKRIRGNGPVIKRLYEQIKKLNSD